jgi:sortase B
MTEKKDIKSERKKLRPLAWVIMAAAFCLVLGGAIYLNDRRKSVNYYNTNTETSAILASSVPLASLQSINPEVIGHLEFDSGLISQNVVQTSDNVKYLSISWDLKEDNTGTVFADYRNTLNDQNIILYGHYVESDESLMFGPLTELTIQENYQKNKNFCLELDGEIREYVITDVYYYSINDDNLKYYLTSYDKDYFETYMKAVKSCEFYHTGEDLEANDKWVTLQTCVKNRANLRLIVLAKEQS